MKSFRNFFSLIGLAAILLSLSTGCSEYIEGEKNLKFQVINNSEFGKILVNQNKQSIYFFAGDVSGETNCTDGCNDTWPPVTGNIYEMELGEGLYLDDFGSIDLEYGEKQITYKGWPLYYFSTEGNGELEKAGGVGGDGRGGVFHVAKPDYSILLGRQPVPASGSELLYLVNDRGVSMYLNTADEENKSNCSGGCAGVWPPVQKTELILPSTLDAYDFDEVYREDDLGPQLSYKGSPIYFFSQDEQKRASVKGQEGGPNKTFFVVEKK